MKIDDILKEYLQATRAAAPSADQLRGAILRQEQGPRRARLWLPALGTVTAVLAALVAVPLVTNLISDGSDEAVVTPGATGDAKSPILLVDEAAVGQAPALDVSGEIGISPQGCVTLGAATLLAPFGSALQGLDPATVRLAGYGEFHVGDQLPARGSIIVIDRKNSPPARFLDCMGPDEETIRLAVLAAS